MELSVAPDGRVFFIERAGNFYVYDPKSNKTSLVYKFPVKAVDKYLNGLLGMTIDPDFTTNHFLYFMNTKEEGGKYSQHISRFAIGNDNVLDLASEKVLIKIPIDLEVSAHTGGSLAWDRYKNMYISTGDNTVPFESDGFAPIDNRPDRLTFSAERSAGNTNDLRGKILRIHPETDGTYTIPEGNLFAKGTPLTRPEIYVMGCRNPYRMSVDTATSFVYWGEVGPDSGTDGAQGPRGYDEFNQAKKQATLAGHILLVIAKLIKHMILQPGLWVPHLILMARIIIRNITPALRYYRHQTSLWCGIRITVRPSSQCWVREAGVRWAARYIIIMRR
jgi:cytochrome c